DVLKLRLLEGLVDGGGTGIAYDGSDRSLADVLRRWTGDRGWSFEWREEPPRAAEWHGGTLHVVEALRYLLRFVRRRRRLAPRRAVSGSRSGLVIATYFPNIDRGAAAAGRFESGYWRALHRLIDERRLNVDWLWLFSDSGDMPLDEAVSLRDALNGQATSTLQRFAFLEEQVRWRDVIRAAALYLRLAVAGFRFRSIARACRLPGSAIDVYPLLEDDWLSSTRGRHAMFIALYAVACRRAVAHAGAPDARLLYLWEGQGWEYLLLDAWKAAGGGGALAVAHTPLCSAPGLLRNRVGGAGAARHRLGPERLVAIGPSAAAGFHALGWPPGVVVEAEALRYEHLADRQRRAPVPDAADGHLLVLTGISAEAARRQIGLLARAERQGALGRFRGVVIRPHPFCPVDHLVDQAGFGTPPRVSTEPVERLLGDAAVVFSAGDTSAAVDAAWMGVPIVVLGAESGLNLSPLRPVREARFVTTAGELVEALHAPAAPDLGRAFFCFDPSLSRWRQLLAPREAA
ncbi:MAG: hypothetical protein FJW23_11040, partial [Acidimicrobiia bacterium]|nr:hypothetical protein [Acidimicrobiia bacterium]